MIKCVIHLMYLHICIATIGGFIAGTTLAWTAPAGPMMENKQYAFMVSNEELAWVGAFMPLGALLGCPLAGLVADKFGRKNMMLVLTIPVLVGWAMIIWAESVSINLILTLIYTVHNDDLKTILNTLRCYGSVPVDF